MPESRSQFRPPAKEKPPLKKEELRFSRAKAYVSVQKPVEGLCPLREFSQASLLQTLREGVEEAPDVSPFECVMSGLTPLMKHVGDQTVGAYADVHGADDQVVGLDVIDFSLFVGGDAGVHRVPFRQEQSNRPGHQLGQVTIDEPGVFPRELYIPIEAEVVANEDTGTSDNACREGFVMGVPKTDNPAVIFLLIFLLCVDFHQAEVALAFMGQRMSLGADAQVGGFESVLDGGDQFVMRDRTPARRGAGCLYLADILQFDV